MKQILLIIFLGASVSATAQILSLSFDDALRQMQQGNRSQIGRASCRERV